MPTPETGGVVHGNEPTRALGDEALHALDRRSAIDAVRLRIGMAVSLGMLRPGERLPDQEEVARGLSVSPITARRALASLAEEGVLVRRRGRGGGTFVADEPSARTLRGLTVPATEGMGVHRLVDRRLLFECALTHFAALRATAEQLARLEQLTRRMAQAQNWSGYHQADDEFHRLVAEAAAVGPAAAEYRGVLERLYGYFIPYSIDRLHESNRDHVRLVRALAARDVEASVEIARQHVDRLHRTMFMGLLDDPAAPPVHG